MVAMQIKSHSMCFYKNNFCLSTLHRFFQVCFISFLLLTTLIFILPAKVFASSYPSIGKIPESSSDNNYSYNSFEEFKRSINYGSSSSEQDNENFSLSSNMMGVSGPFSFNVTWSDDYGLILNTQFVHMISQKSAYAIEADLGFKMDRLNLTIGQALTKTNRIKLTVEGLAQKQSFDFDSGSVEKWVSQYAGGGEFQHILGEGFLNNISLGGYYAQALNKTLDPVLYFDANKDGWINYRHIAGAVSKGVNTSLGVRPWKTAIITLTGYYDWLHYRNIYENVSAEDSNELGYGISLSQYISSSLEVTANYINRAVYRSIEFGLSFCHNIFHDTRSLALSISGARSSSDNVSRENSLTIGFNYYFAPMNNTYHIPGFQMSSFKAWISKPAVRMDQVLAAADQMSERAKVSSPTSNVFTYSEVDTTGTITEQISWDGITSNVPNAQLEYYLTIKDDTSASTNSQLKNDESSLPDNQLVHGTTYTVHNLNSGGAYRVILRAVEKNSGADSIFSDTFTAGTDKITWPDGFEPKLIDVTMKDNGVVRAKLTFDTAYSSQHLEILYDVEIKDGTTSIFHEKDLKNENVKQGINIDCDLHKGKSYTVIVTPSDNAGTADPQTNTVNTDYGKMNWSDAGLSYTAGSDLKTVILQWSQAEPSVPNDTVYYSIKISKNPGKTTPEIGQYSCDQAKKLCWASVSNLTQNTEGYQAMISASDQYDEPPDSKLLPFSTKQTGINWMVEQVGFSQNDKVITWNSAQPSDPKDKVIYHITVVSEDGTKVIDNKASDSNGTKAQYSIKGSDNILQNHEYYVMLTASDTKDKPETRGEANKSSTLFFMVDPGNMQWKNANADLDEISTQENSVTLKWSQAIPSIEHTTITYKVEIHGGDTIERTIFSNDTNYCEGSSCHITIGNLVKGESYTVQVKADDEIDSELSSAQQKFAIVEWENWTNDSIVIECSSGQDYTCTFSVPDYAKVTTSPNLGTIKFKYQYKLDSQAEYTAWEDLPDPAEKKTIHNVLVQIFVRVKAYIDGDDGVSDTVANSKRK